MNTDERRSGIKMLSALIGVDLRLEGVIPKLLRLSWACHSRHPWSADDSDGFGISARAVCGGAANPGEGAGRRDGADVPRVEPGGDGGVRHGARSVGAAVREQFGCHIAAARGYRTGAVRARGQPDGGNLAGARAVTEELSRTMRMFCTRRPRST